MCVVESAAGWFVVIPSVNHAPATGSRDKIPPPSTTPRRMRRAPERVLGGSASRTRDPWWRARGAGWGETAQKRP